MVTDVILLLVGVVIPILFKAPLALMAAVWASAIATALLVRCLRGLWPALVICPVSIAAGVLAILSGVNGFLGLLPWIAIWVLTLRLAVYGDTWLPGARDGYGRPPTKLETEDTEPS